MSNDTEKELLRKIDKLEKMLMTCKKSLDSYQHTLDLIYQSYANKENRK